MPTRPAVRIVLALVLAAMTITRGAHGISSDLRGETATQEGDLGRGTAAASPPSRGPRAVHLLFFWGVGCPHCEKAMGLVLQLESVKGVTVERIEVRRSDEGRARLAREIERLRIPAAGIPLFVVGDRWVVGYREGATDDEVMSLVRRAQLEGHAPTETEPSTVVVLPIVGRLDAADVPLPWFTLAVGLLDGLNPCAFYVLIALLGVLLRAPSRARIALFGGTFVVISGLVYFLFMAAWLHAFLALGTSRWLTRALGLLLVAMALVNLKELAWFKKGVSLMIPDRAKPGLFRRMRNVTHEARLSGALVAIGVLALLVNLVELGCTLGLPAIYTRVLSLHPTMGSGARYAYLALYNVAYVVPLALIVVVYAVTLHRLTMTERRGKILKGVSGALLLVFGLLFAVAPELLG